MNKFEIAQIFMINTDCLCTYDAKNSEIQMFQIQGDSIRLAHKILMLRSNFRLVENLLGVLLLYLLSFVETPRKFIIAELSIRKLGSSSVLTKSRYYKERQVDRKKRKAIRR